MYLIEVLIAFFILSLVLLGLDAALLYSLQHSKSTYYADRAFEQLNNLAERMDALNNAPLSVELVKTWNKQNQELLPDGRGTLFNQYPSYQVISIFWGKQIEQICKRNQIGQSGCLRISITN